MKKICKHFNLWHFIQNFYWSIPLLIKFDEIDGFIKIYDRGIYLELCSNNLYDETCDLIRKYILCKKEVLHILLIIILQESELIHIIIYLLKKYWLFIIL